MRRQPAKPGYHWHHIKPKHMGGTNETSNMIELTIADHAEAHRNLYEKFGFWQDRVAWQMLSGQITVADATKEAQRNGDKSWMRTEEGRAILREGHRKAKERRGLPNTWNRGLTKETDARLAIASELSKKNMKEGRIRCIGDSMRGKLFTDSHKSKLAEIARNRLRVICEHCGTSVIKQMYVRWHGPKCKSIL